MITFKINFKEIVCALKLIMKIIFQKNQKLKIFGLVYNQFIWKLDAKHLFDITSSSTLRPEQRFMHEHAWIRTDYLLGDYYLTTS
jgi:hypothetical protein